MRAEAAEVLLGAADPVHAGLALFEQIAPELKLDIFLLYAAGGYGELELVAHGGLRDDEAAIMAAQEPPGFGGGRAIPPAGHISGAQQLDEAGLSFLAGIGIEAWFEQPLMAGERLLGVLGFGRRWTDSFQEGEVAFLQRVGHYFGLTLRRLRGEAALRESEERLKLGMTVAGFRTYDTNLLTGQVDFWPKPPADILSPADYPTSIEQIRNAVHPDDLERVRAAIKARHDPEGGGAFDQEFRVVRRDGQVRWVHVRSQTFFAEEGGSRRAVRVIGAQRGITRSKLAEERLRESEERLRLAVEAAGFCVFEYDVERDEAIWSPELRTIWEFGPDEVINLEKVARQVHPEDRQLFLTLFSSAGSGHESDDHCVEFRIIRSDGETRWVMTKARQLFEPDSARPKRIIGVSQDITEGKLAAERLRVSEERLQLAQQLGGVASFEFIRGVDDVWVSESFRRIFGFPPAAPVSAPIIRAIVHPEDRDRVGERVLKITELEAGEIEYRIIRPSDRKVRWVYLAMGGQPEPSTGVLRVAGIALDITERKRNEERERLLSREVDHRARNLLSVVQAMIQLTQANSIPELVGRLQGRIQALGRVHGLLAASRWNGAELAQLVADELAPFADARDRLAMTGPSVGLKPAAAQSIALVIHELTTNAAKHGALSAPGGRVDISWEISPDGKLMLHWRETGGPSVAPPQHSGFGMTLVRGSVERQLGGAVDMNWRAEGLHCELALPASLLVQESG